MAGENCQINLSQLTFSPAPPGSVSVDIHYRNILDDAGNPASWTLVDTVSVTSGGLISPEVAVFVPYGETYELRITSSCSVYFEQIGCAPTTTTSTTTTTSSTTTTTTADPFGECTEYYNNTGSDITGVDYRNCVDENVNNATVTPGQSICAKAGSVVGGTSGFLIVLGPC